MRLTVVRATSLPSTFSTTSAGRTGLGDRRVHFDPVLALGDLLLRSGRVALDDHHVVFVDELALVHVKRESSGSAAERVEHAGGVFTKLGLDRHPVALAAQAGGGEFGHAGRRSVELPACVGRLYTVFRVKAQPVARTDGEGLVCLRFLEEQRLHLGKPLAAPWPRGRPPAKSRCADRRAPRHPCLRPSS